MTFEQLFKEKERADQSLSARDTATHRVCGTCNNLLPLESFYKDGKNPDGSTRYRRDCKACYKNMRAAEYLYKKGVKT
jgi:hypothetical protein